MIYIKDKLITQQIMFEVVQEIPILELFSLLCYHYILLCSKVYKRTPLVDHSFLSNYETT
jgi:hypothetical protein